MGVIVDVIGNVANENDVVVSAYYVAVRTIVLSSHEGGRGCGCLQEQCNL